MKAYARETAFCLVYRNNMETDRQEDFLLFDEDKLTDADKQFCSQLVDFVSANKQKIDDIISSYSKGFRLQRLCKTDLAVLETAIGEMMSCDTPFPVVINEAVGFAEKYSTPKSASFVNGILASYVRERQ